MVATFGYTPTEMHRKTCDRTIFYFTFLSFLLAKTIHVQIAQMPTLCTHMTDKTGGKQRGGGVRAEVRTEVRLQEEEMGIFVL